MPGFLQVINLHYIITMDSPTSVCLPPSTSTDLLALATLPCSICRRPLSANLPLATVPCGASFHKACLVSAASPIPVSPSTASTILSALGVNVGTPPPQFTCPAGTDADEGGKPHTHLGDPGEFGSDVVLSDVVDKVATLLAPFLLTVPTQDTAAANEANDNHSALPSSSRGLKRRRESTQSSLEVGAGELEQQKASSGTDGDDQSVHDDSASGQREDDDQSDASASDSPSTPSRESDKYDSHSQSDSKPVTKVPRLHSPTSSSTASLVQPSPPTYSLPYAEFDDHLTCPLCYHLLDDPITLSPCGHTACRACLLRTLDHSANARNGQFRCFVCRKHLWGSYVAYLHHAPNATLERIMRVAFSDQVQARKDQLAQDELRASANDQDQSILHNVPLFVCNLAFPGQRVPLHIFEPRYRLMLRRITAPGGDRMFGMLHYTRAPGGGAGIPTHGTMMHVDHVDFLPDGRSLVETSGKFVFKLTDTSDVHTGDGGYLVARTAERLEDSEYLAAADPVPGEVAQVAARLKDTFPHVLEEREALQTYVSVAQFARLCVAATHGFLSVVPPQFRAGARAQIGEAHVDKPEWLGYWLTGTLPLPESVQYRLLEEPSPRRRLVLAVQWMEQVGRVDARGPIGVVAQMVGCNVM
ncbi:PUA-like domain-containing protein [Catenaria anguillulae PL171]|uniref:PUA-like domain-containing protein n=1 Tax=Catenaria anguillulae PL171 TaxID=765915 RepID=A0A1Y2HXK0_9FUNG|nr:PUA-like domain-containing protein [Catenaria anguillulae PL171]